MRVLKPVKYNGYKIRIRKVNERTYDWDIIFKDKGKWYVADGDNAMGTAFVENKKQVVEIAKEYLDKRGLRQ